MKQEGFFWHVHHEILLEWCHSYNERAAYIRTQKPARERKLRLRLFQPVKGRLPDAVLEAAAAYTEAKAAYNKASAVYNRNNARATYGTVEAAYDKAAAAYDKARVAFEKTLKAHRAEIKALHKAECPSCSWNGHTIFPGKTIFS